MHRIAQCSVTACVLSLALAGASPAAAQDKVQLARKAKVGDVTRTASELTFAVDMGGQQASLSVKSTEKATVTDVTADGRVTSRTEAEGMEISLNGSPMPPQPLPPASTVVVAKDRSLVSYTSGSPEGGGIEVRLYSATTAVFPETAIGVGDAWTRDIKADPAKGINAGTAEYKVVGREKVGNADTLKITMAFRETAADGIRATATFWVDIATGEEAKAEIEFQNVAFPNVGMVNGSIRQARLAPGVK